MRDIVVYLRLRHAGLAAVALGLVAGAGVLVGTATVQPRSGTTFHYPLAMIVPALLGSLIVAFSQSPLAEWERTSTRPLAPLRIGVTALHVAFAAGALVPVGLVAGGEQGPVSAVRNLLGFTGLAALGAAVGGPRSSWIAPLCAVSIPPFFFASADQDTIGVITFFAQPDDAGAALAACVATGVVGVVATGRELPLRRLGPA